MSFPIPSRWPAGRLPHGMTLIEVIGVLAILSILAAVLLPALIKESDKVAADQELASMQSFGDALQRYIVRNRRIPGPGGLDWATNIAAELGVDIGTLTNNIRRQSRVFLIDTNGFGNLTLPYTQTSTGVSCPPNPRVMLVSSLGKPLPAGLASGGLSTVDFTNLWCAAPGKVPTTGVWNGWTGNPSDITVQRVSLSPLFVDLLLSTYYSSWNCAYSIDGNNSVPVTNLFSNYFIQNSVLNLFYTNQANAGILDSSQVLIRDSSFVFYGNEWRRSIGTNSFVSYPSGGSGGNGSNGGGTNGINGYDFSGLINGFLSANPANPATMPKSQQTNVVLSFMQYMSNYNAWAASNFTNQNLYDIALHQQTVMMSNVNALVNAITPQ